MLMLIQPLVLPPHSGKDGSFAGKIQAVGAGGAGTLFLVALKNHMTCILLPVQLHCYRGKGRS